MKLSLRFLPHCGHFQSKYWQRGFWTDAFLKEDRGGALLAPGSQPPLQD